MSATANANTLVTLFGGSGFLGRHVARALAERHYRLRIAVRRPYLAVQQLGRPGQIETVRADVRVPRMVEAAVRDAAVVINLVGILFERGEQQFDAVQAKGAGLVARAAAERSNRFISRFGPASVFLARFTAVVRAFVPLIAGILRMSPLRFYVANILSALVWAPAHVFPGVLLATALRLAGVSAEQLTVLIIAGLIVVLAVVWAMRLASERS